VSAQLDEQIKQLKKGTAGLVAQKVDIQRFSGAKFVIPNQISTQVPLHSPLTKNFQSDQILLFPPFQVYN